MKASAALAPGCAAPAVRVSLATALGLIMLKLEGPDCKPRTLQSGTARKREIQNNGTHLSSLRGLIFSLVLSYLEKSFVEGSHALV